MEGELPYKDGDIIIPTDGNRFEVRFKKRGINSTSDLPSGNIVKTTHTEKPGGYNIGTKSDFESDGSLIVIFDIKEQTKAAYLREVKIAWTKKGETLEDSDFTTYTFDLSRTTLAPVE